MFPEDFLIKNNALLILPRSHTLASHSGVFRFKFLQMTAQGET
jgi:hypothetical protein